MTFRVVLRLKSLKDEWIVREAHRIEDRRWDAEPEWRKELLMSLEPQRTRRLVGYISSLR